VSYLYFFEIIHRVVPAFLEIIRANLVPTHQLISDDDSYILLAHSAVDAGMNMMRIWGGGEIPTDSFYDVADERGLLIFHDLMFVDEQGHGATKTLDIMLEIRDLVRRLSSHPSIVLWNGCNEVSLPTLF
jgi:beta-galactosidase/beta-glucuronidase